MKFFLCHPYISMIWRNFWQSLKNSVGGVQRTVSLDRLPGFSVSCHGSSCTYLDESNVQRHLPSPCWDQPIFLSSDSCSEVLFWKQNYDSSGYLIRAPSPKVEVLSYSDASGLGWGGFAVHINGKPAVRSWLEEESGRSSKFGGLRAIRYVLESYCSDLYERGVSQDWQQECRDHTCKVCW